MTELQQKDYDELLEQLRQEETVCETCPSRNEFCKSDICDGCGTHGNIQDIEMQLAELSGE